jgi:hypothetical protein
LTVAAANRRLPLAAIDIAFVTINRINKVSQVAGFLQATYALGDRLDGSGADTLP